MILTQTFQRLHDQTVEPKPADILSVSQKKLVLERLKAVQKAKAIVKSRLTNPKPVLN